MSGSFRFVAYAAASDELEAAIGRHQAEDPLAPVTVVTPSLRIGQSLRHRLARRRRPDGRAGLANVRFSTLADVADELGGAAARIAGRRRVTRLALGAAARVALSEDAGFLSLVADQPSTEAELVALYEELRQHDAETLAGLATRGATGHDLAQLCRGMRTRLASDWYDDADLIEEAVRSLEADTRSGVLDGPIIVHLPVRARPAECRLVAALARRVELVVHVGATGDGLADRPSARLAAVLADAGLDGPAAVFAGKDESGDTVAVSERIEAADVDSEVRAALRIVIDHLATGRPSSRVALLYPSAKTYLAALAGAIDAAEIAWNGRSPLRIAESPAARFITGAARLARDGLERERVMGWINSAAIVDERGVPLRLARFERVSRLAGVLQSDTDGWHRHLEALINDPTRREGDLEAARDLDAFISELGRYCDQARACRTWTDFERWARLILCRYLGWKDVDSERTGGDARLDSVLAELGRLDVIEPEANLSRFLIALEGALERSSTYHGRLSRGIAVWKLEDAVGLDLDLAVILGGVEGELPPRARATPLLDNEDRVGLGLDAATPESVNAAARHALVSLTQTSIRTVCTWRLRDADATARVRSRFFGHDEVALVPSPVDALRAVASGRLPALSGSELVVATLRERRTGRGDFASFHLVRDDTDLVMALRVVRSRAAHVFDRFDGRIPEAVEWTAERVVSPTTLETYASCPFRYFVSSELGVRVVDEPEQRVFIDPRDRGSIVHEVLERFVADLMKADADSADVDTPAHLVHIAEEVFGRYERLGRTGAPVFWRRERRRLLAILEQERSADAERRRSDGRRPVALEWCFGIDDAPPLDVSLSRETIVFRGKVDRIDRRSDDALCVVDYKTGRSRSFDGLADDPVDGGRHLQLAIYALASHALIDGDVPVHASYRFLDEGGAELSVTLDDALRARASEVVGVIVDGVRAGLFPYNPGAPNWQSFQNCTFCDFDSLCPPNRDDFWDQAAKSADLVAYLALDGTDG